MPSNKILTQQERETVLNKVKPVGQFKASHQRGGFGAPPLPWEDRIGDINEYRQHQGMGRVIAPALADAAKTMSVRNSIKARFKKLFPEESWTTYVEDGKILLRFNGPARHHTSSRQTSQHEDGDGDGDLFAQTG